MTGLLEAAGDPGTVGFDAGWKLELRVADQAGNPSDDAVLSFSRGDYFATMRVHRTSGFAGATFEIAIEGLSDDHHRKIVGGPYVFAKLKLGWRDLGSGAGAPFADIGALFSGSEGDDSNYHEVIHARITSYERLHGTFRYVTKIAGVDHRFHRLRTLVASQPELEAGSPAMSYVERLCEQADVPLVKHPPNGPFEAIDERIEINREDSIAQALDHVSKRAHAGGRGAQIPLHVGVDGVHFGQWMGTAELGSLEQQNLGPSAGLVESRPVVETDAAAVADADPLGLTTSPNPFAVTESLKSNVIMRGRADLTIGDLVGLVIDEPNPGDLTPTTASSVLGGLGDVVSGVVDAFGPAVEPDYEQCRVVDVRHALDRSKGFVTTLVVQRQPAEVAGDTEPQASSSQRSSDEAARTAALVRQSARERAEVDQFDVGVVRAQSVKFQEVDGHYFQPQRVEVDAGLNRSAQSNGAATADPVETPTRLFNKSYLTPFAFEGTGLVVPHYPGMRVATLNYREDARHAVVAGCLWRDTNERHSDLGDYWLSLPVGLASAERADDPASLETQTRVESTVHDLIDGDGGRAVHVSGLRISVGQTHLLGATARPDNAVADEVLIEHTAGTSIRIDDEGNIEISTTKDLTMNARRITMNVTDKVEVVK